MFTTNYSAYIIKKKHANLIGLIAGFAAVAAVFYCVGLYAGKQAPEGLKQALPYILIVTLVLALGSFLLYFNTRFKIIVTGENEKLTIEIKDPALTAPLIINSPIKISTQWMEQLTGKGPKIKLLYLTICNQKNEPLVTFEGALGAAYSVPKHFEYLNILDTEQRKKLIIAPVQYSNGKLRELTDEINIYLKYINKKKENAGGPPSE